MGTVPRQASASLKTIALFTAKPSPFFLFFCPIFNIEVAPAAFTETEGLAL